MNILQNLNIIKKMAVEKTSTAVTLWLSVININKYTYL